jgi:alpha-glucosidase (family GH31 glycosyl hydrolase)
MKNIVRLANVIFIAVILQGCQHNSIVKIETKKGYPRFILNTDIQSKHVIIAGNETGETGSVFYETSSGKTWIKGFPDKTEADTNKFKAVWSANGREIIIKFIKKNNQFSFSFQAIPDTGILKWGFSISATEDEYFTGLYERVIDGDQRESWKQGIAEAMNLRGQEVDMLIKPTLSLYCPFYLSSNGYGLFIEGTWPGHYDICKTDPHRVNIAFEGAFLEGIIYTAKHPAEIVREHSLHTGPTILPPRWAFLPWRWRDNHDNNKKFYDGTPVKVPYNSMLVEDILMMKALDIPCGAYWIDRPWAKGVHGYEDFEWDLQRFPNPKQMIDWLHNNDVRLMLWIAPWVAGNMRQQAIDSGYAMQMKAPHGKIDSSNAALIDFTNPIACKWWQVKGIEKMLLQGIDGFKLDRSEELVPETRSLKVSDGRTTREIRNHYPVLYVKAVNESCTRILGNDFVIFPRAGYTGSSKYGVFWGGDIGSPAEGLRTAIIAVQRSAIIGFPIWGSDIGGYWQGSLDREVCARWLAFGCFSPIMEFGPTEDRAPWDMKSEPHYDTTLIAIWRLYAKIHATLADYSFNLAKVAHETGMPVVRPLFIEFPEQKVSWENWQSFMYGPDILVCSIWQKGVEKINVYLPAGTKWRDAWDKEKIYEGGQYIEVETPIYKIPIFIRDGSMCELGNLNKLYTESLEIAKTPPDLLKISIQKF